MLALTTIVRDARWFVASSAASTAELLAFSCAIVAGPVRDQHTRSPTAADELPSANALSALQHRLSGTLSLSPFRTVTRLHYLNLDLKHICSPPSMLVLFASASGATATWRFTNFVLYYCWFPQSYTATCSKSKPLPITTPFYRQLMLIKNSP